MIRRTIPYPIYNFLGYCNESPLEKKVLDCGAGGSNPPLWLFHEYGYQTHGVEISTAQIDQSMKFCQDSGINLGIVQGDMKNIPFGESSFSFLFSYNTSVHMSKQDFLKALSEFARVTQSGGLCYVNFLSTDCDTYGDGVEVADGEFLQEDEEGDVLFCHYKIGEPEQLMTGFEIIYKEIRTIERLIRGNISRSSYYDYNKEKYRLIN